MIKRSFQDDYDASLIYNVYHNSNETYGYRRIKQALLEEYGLVMNHKKIQRLKKEYNIFPEYSKKRKQTVQKKSIEENCKTKFIKKKFYG